MLHFLRALETRTLARKLSKWRTLAVASLLPIALAAASPAARAKTTVEALRDDDKAVRIDGSADEWQGRMFYLDGPGFHVGARHDGSHLYLCFHASDPQVGYQAMGRGLVLQLDPTEGKPLKIQYPVGLFESGEPMRDPRSRDRERMRQRVAESLDTFIVFAPKLDQRQYVPIDNDFGIELRVDTEGGRFVYELKVPLARDDAHPYAVGAAPGTGIALKLDTPKIDSGSMQPPGGGMGRGGMRGGMGGGMGRGGMGGGPRGGGSRQGDQSEPLHLKAKILLIEEPASDRE